MNVLSDIAEGISLVKRGIFLFYSNRAWWKYGVLPALLLLTVYALLFYAAFAWLMPYLTGLLPDFGGNFFGTALKGVVWIISALTGILLMLLLFSPFYEAAGGLFFDALTKKCIKDMYGEECGEASFAEALKLFPQTLLFGVMTCVLACLLWWLAFVPFVGKILLVLIFGYRYGLAYLFYPAAAEGMGVGEVKKLAGKHYIPVLSFGCTAFLLAALPVLSVFFIPGIAVGGILLHREKLSVK